MFEGLLSMRRSVSPLLGLLALGLGLSGCTLNPATGDPSAVTIPVPVAITDAL